MSMVKLRYTGKATYQFGVTVFRDVFDVDPLVNSTLELPARHADELLHLEPDSWERVQPTTPTPASEPVRSKGRTDKTESETE